MLDRRVFLKACGLLVVTPVSTLTKAAEIDSRLIVSARFDPNAPHEFFSEVLIVRKGDRSTETSFDILHDLRDACNVDAGIELAHIVRCELEHDIEAAFRIQKCPLNFDDLPKVQELTPSEFRKLQFVFRLARKMPAYLKQCLEIGPLDLSTPGTFTFPVQYVRVRSSGSVQT